MKRKKRKMQLTRETVRTLSSSKLLEALGGTSCPSQHASCNGPCGTGSGGDDGCANTL